MLNEAVRAAFENLRRQLDAAAIEALKSGSDWAEGPIEDPNPNLWMDTWNILDQPKVEFTVRCGPVSADYVPPAGWRVVRRADWLAAGMPGLDTMREIERPKCGCKSATVQRVILENGACGMGGCPYGGDL